MAIASPPQSKSEKDRRGAPERGVAACILGVGACPDRDENHEVVLEVSSGAKRNVPEGEKLLSAPFVLGSGNRI